MQYNDVLHQNCSISSPGENSRDEEKETIYTEEQQSLYPDPFVLLCKYWQMSNENSAADIGSSSRQQQLINHNHSCKNIKEFN